MGRCFTKAQTLLDLQQHIKGLNILPILIVKSNDFYCDIDRTVKKVMAFANGEDLIIRSSSSQEDSIVLSNAGRFKSIQDVKADYDEIKNCIDEVYKSYNSGNDEEILIQPMLSDVKRSGVVFTRDIDTYAEYYVINYGNGNDTEAVTGGGFNDLKTYVLYKRSPVNCVDEEMKSLVSTCEQIERYLQNDALDIEFAISSDGKVYIFQVRPIAQGQKEKSDSIDLAPALNRIYKKAQKLSAPHPFLLGKTTCFGVMPDWNPAEILGVRPKKLAISLYKELVTDFIWAHQRKNYGYRDLTMHPLMISFCGIPYIDTRITFNSFIPAKLDKTIADKLVNYYLRRLEEYPKYHDKIEFEIVYSCYYLGLPKRLKGLLCYGFNENEITRIEFALLELTNNIIDPEKGIYREDIRKIQKLEDNYQKIMNSDISLVDKIYWLIEECKEYGTLPFAGVARAGFIAVQFLHSFVDNGIISQNEFTLFMNSMNTVNKQLSTDLDKYYSGCITKEEFLKKYGHIRPGTYDILSKRYDEAFETYFSGRTDRKITRGKKDSEYAFSLSDHQIRKLQTELDENGLLISSEELLSFIKESIEGREYLKFVFTKSVSTILQLIEELGNRADISKEDMAHIDISVVKQLYVDLQPGMITDIFRENINNNKRQYDFAKQIKLPSIIVKPDDIYSFYLLEEEPNFITQKSITADTVVYSENVDIEHKIVFIQSADPGYDFVFTKDISGLITQYGGANSHMAIRCAELGIPAVIGVGEKRFDEWSSYRMMELDCLKKQIIRIE